MLQTSPDGFLLQSATVAERVPVSFSDGSNALLPGAYIEFAERMVLPQFQHLKVRIPVPEYCLTPRLTCNPRTSIVSLADELTGENCSIDANTPYLML